MHLLNVADGTWSSVVEEWRKQCDVEDFEIFCDGIFGVVENLAKHPEQKAAVLGVKLEGQTVAVCQVNTKLIKGYEEPVLRVRHLILSPYYDLNDVTTLEYGKVIVSVFNSVLEVSDDHQQLGAKHIKFHLRSSSDQQFFTAMGDGLRHSDLFDTVQSKGAWLYVTKA